VAEESEKGANNTFLPDGGRRPVVDTKMSASRNDGNTEPLLQARSS